MTRWHWWVIVAGVLSVCACLCGLILSVRADVVQAPRLAVETRQLALDELRALRADLVHQAEQARVEALALADRQAGGIRADARDQLNALRSDANARIGETLARVDRATETIEGVRTDLKPVLADANELLQQTSGTVAVLRPQTLGLIAAAKVTAGETAQAARRFDGALPQMLLTWNDIGLHVARATDESAKTAEQSRLFMENLAQATKPLPTWARISLAVAPPIVQTGFTTASWLALRGKSK